MESQKNVDDKKMNENFKFSGDLDKQSKALKEKYPKLTNEDVKFEKGKEQELIKRLEDKLDKNRKEVVGILNANSHTVTK